MSTKKIEPLHDLKDTILDLLRILKEDMLTENNEQGDLMLVEFFFRRMHPETLMSHIVRHVLPHENQIKRRDLNFFLENRGLFAGLPEDRVGHYSQIIAYSDRLDTEDRNELWEYFDTIVALASHHRKLK